MRYIEGGKCDAPPDAKGTARPGRVELRSLKHETKRPLSPRVAFLQESF